jgi:hypothetical protein
LTNVDRLSRGRPSDLLAVLQARRSEPCGANAAKKRLIDDAVKRGIPLDKFVD